MLKHYVEFKLISGKCEVRELKDRTLVGVTIPENCSCYWFFDRECSGKYVGKKKNVSKTIYNGTIYSFDYIKEKYPGSSIVPLMKERGLNKVLHTSNGKWIPIR